MSRPDVSDLTEAVYASLPELYRAADATQVKGPGYPLLRYLSLSLDQLEPVIDLVRRFTYIAQDERQDNFAGNSYGLAFPLRFYGSGLYGSGYYGSDDVLTLNAELVDGRVADSAWLPWLAQLLGVDLSRTLSEADRRDKLRNPLPWRAHGTPGAIAEAARTVLTPAPGTTAYVYSQAAGTSMLIALYTKHAETPTSTTWGQLKAAAPTWGDLRTLGAFINGRAAALILAANVERPAGWVLIHQWVD